MAMGFDGRDTLRESAPERLQLEERIYQGELARALRQKEHEEGCPACARYAAPMVGKPRSGRPCPVGARFWGL